MESIARYRVASGKRDRTDIGLSRITARRNFNEYPTAHEEDGGEVQFFGLIYSGNVFPRALA